jgi:hypothetical protein
LRRSQKRHELAEKAALRQAHYHLSQERVLTFSIDMDQVEYMTPKSTRKDEETFLTREFKKLFGTKPKFNKYSCSKISGKVGVSFGNIRGEVFTVRSPVLLAGELYHFNFFRKGNP